VEIPTPPTDSLYKFMAIGGVILMLGGLYISYRLVHDLEERQATTTPIFRAAKAEAEIRAARRQETETELQRVEKGVIGRPCAGFKGFEKETIAGDMLASDFAKLHTLIARDKSDWESARRQMAILDGKLDVVRESIPGVRLNLAMCLILGCVGAYYTVKGFHEWRQKIQKPQDELLQIQLEQARLAFARTKAESATPMNNSEGSAEA
jgi:hypothetical protein